MLFLKHTLCHQCKQTVQPLGKEQDTHQNKAKRNTKEKIKVEIIMQDHRILELEEGLGNKKQALGPALEQTIGSKERSRRV